MEQKKYWQSFGERSESESYQNTVNDEFREELPFESDGGLMDAVTPRRDFLKYLGFSTAAAAVAASCEVPVRKAIPFANKPEEIVPGIANYYATTYVQDGDVLSVLAKVRDGRPIKIEGNELSPIYSGGTSARAQASVLDLYDTARLRFPMVDKKEVTFASIDKAITQDLSSATGAVVVLTNTVVSPSSKEVINNFLAKFPGAKHVQYDAVSYSGMLLANEATYGKRAIPSYDFSKAKVIVSLGADFLGTWLSPVEFNRQYAVGRRIDEKNPQMSRHYQFESVASLTGSNADEKYLHRPSQTGLIANALLTAIGGGSVSGLDKNLTAGIQKAARDLAAANGNALVVCSSNDVHIQTIVNAINNQIGANGKTIDWSSSYNLKQGIDADMASLIQDMNAGAVSALIVYGTNPVYSWVDGKAFSDALAKVKTTVSLNPKMDETAAVCRYVIPDHHYLESWGDAEPKTGYYSFQQPTIHPLFKTRQWQDSLMKWAGSTEGYVNFVKAFWGSKLGGENNYNIALQNGIAGAAKGLSVKAPATGNLADSTTTATAAGIGATTQKVAFNSATLATAQSSVSTVKSGEAELVIYQKVGLGEGGHSGNPWLQELPDPVTRATWDNYAIISPAMAKKILNIDLSNGGQSDSYEVNPEKKMVTITTGNKTIELPALIIPGTDEHTIGIAVGYGRIGSIGKAADGVGKNAYPFTTFNGTTVDHYNPSVKVSSTGKRYPVALTQTHFRYNTSQGVRTEVIKEVSLKDFQKNPKIILEDRERELGPFGGTENFQSQGTIYPVFDRPGIQWAMSIDMNTCTGCSACVVACHTENNVPVVGKSEVMRFHDMHWLRIDRYYSGSLDNPDVSFQPMLCQHCNNAPCENVCPVAATNHSSEGINQMAYNRCVGTRYCANNCPYKVRRFNWADYTGADSFPDNQKQVLDDVVMMLNDPLPRMVLNPDVTVRARGVMEKCTFCIQRTQEGKLKAKKENRPLKSGQNGEWDVKSACQQACPTNAIVFGNLNDKESAIYKTRQQNAGRTYYALEQLHTMPGISYLAKVRNSDLMDDSPEPLKA